MDVTDSAEAPVRTHDARHPVTRHGPELDAACDDAARTYERVARPTPVEPEARQRLRISERHAAENILNRTYADPDDDPAIVARAALRLGAVEPDGLPLDVERLRKAVNWAFGKNYNLVVKAIAAEYARLAPTPSEAKP